MKVFENLLQKFFEKKWLTGRRNDVEYAALIEQQLKRSLKS
ncbi:hypothetical protein F6453_3660 [Marinobacter nauticus]|uniref:Uncharacterized protein n=1 Tax=Marinobacter nauticus TaxID=2743 RepID=A0A833N8E2_MARNT|nr:hypothetical protein F6453_3660 [Marinobacter nauticus]